MGAKVALRVAREKLAQAKSHLKQSISTGNGIPQAKLLVEKCEEILKKAKTLWKRVSFAKKETRIAIRNYEKIVAKAREAEKKAIAEEEKVQNARTVVQKVEYIERKCKPKSKKLTKVEKHVVSELRKQVSHINHNITLHKKTVIALTKKLVTATSTEQKNSIHHNIIKTKKKIVTLSKKIRNLNSVINNLLITKRTYKKRKLVKIE